MMKDRNFVTSTGLFNKMKHLVFVYGTLKNSYGLHTVLEASECVTSEDYTLDKNFKMVYSNGERGFPFVFRVDDGGRQVRGEVYLVDDETLAQLDAVEGVPYMYKREKVPLSSGREAFMYISPVDRNGSECGPEGATYYDWG